MRSYCTSRNDDKEKKRNDTRDTVQDAHGDSGRWSLCASVARQRTGATGGVPCDGSCISRSAVQRVQHVPCCSCALHCINRAVFRGKTAADVAMVRSQAVQQDRLGRNSRKSVQDVIVFQVCSRQINWIAAEKGYFVGAYGVGRAVDDYMEGTTTRDSLKCC